MESKHPTQVFNPNKEDYQPVKQHDDIYMRKAENGAWRVLPIISLLVILGVFGYTIFRVIQLFGNPFKTNLSGAYLFILAGTLVSLLLFPLYIMLVYLLKDVIKKLYIGTPIVSCMVVICAGIYTQNTGLIVSGAVPLSISLLYFWCLWSDIKIAVITIKTAASQFNKVKRRIFTQFVVILLLTSMAVGFYVLTVMNSLAMIGLGASLFNFSKVNTEEQKIILSLVSVSAFFLVYFLEFLAAVSFIYGAAFFNQFSISKAEYEEKDFETSAEEAYHIAFSSSLGTACIGALIITIVSFIVNSAKSNAEDNKGDIGALLLYCVAKIIGDILEFLTSQAYVYSAFYGKGLFTSGKMGVESFKTAGIDKFINFKLTSSMLNILTFFISAILSLGVGFAIYVYGLGIIENNKQPTPLDIYIAIVIGVFIITALAVPFYSVNSMIGGSAASQIAVYVEDPDRFRKSHKKAEKFEKYLRA